MWGSRTRALTCFIPHLHELFTKLRCEFLLPYIYCRKILWRIYRITNFQQHFFLVNNVKSICKRYSNIEDEGNQNLNQLLSEITPVGSQYIKEINTKTTLYGGAMTTYQIRFGMLLNIQKWLAKKLELEWVEWFNENYGQRHLRTAQDYMKLARTPNIIRYAIFGKERLIQITRLRFSDEAYKRYLDLK